MRLVDADRMKGNTPNWLLETDGIRERYLYDELDHQPTVIEGDVKESEYCCERITKIKPLVITYSINPRYVKYTCPVCSALGNDHQLSKGIKNCDLCNVNLIWDDIE
jgi:hypothetical protein